MPRQSAAETWLHFRDLTVIDAASAPMCNVRAVCRAFCPGDRRTTRLRPLHVMVWDDLSTFCSPLVLVSE